jgi:hypothetical protein
MHPVQTLPIQTKNVKAFYAHLYDASGVLAKVNNELVFFSDDNTIVTVEPSMINFLTVLGEVGVAGAALALDTLHGGAPRICTSRQMEVQ